MHRIPDLISGEVVSALALAVTSSPVEGPSNPFSIDDMPHNRDAASLWTKGQDPDGMGGATYYHTLCGMSRSGEAMLALALAVTSSPVEGPSNPFPLMICHTTGMRVVADEGTGSRWRGGAQLTTLFGMSGSVVPTLLHFWPSAPLLYPP